MLFKLIQNIEPVTSEPFISKEEVMLENVRIGIDESTFKIKADESINRMLGCLLNESAKTCKNCRDVTVCSFLTEAVFAYRNQFTKEYNSLC